MPAELDADRSAVAAVTGASTGLGRALARELASRGWRVGLLARRRALLRELAREIASAGGEAVVAPCDVTRRDEVEEAMRRVAGELGPVELLVANAGRGAAVPVDGFDVEQVERTYRVNLLGAVYAIAAVLPSMLERGRGHLVGVSSLSAYFGSPVHSAYPASKAALNTQLEGLRIELAPRGIRVTTVCPGFIRTPMIEHRSFPKPFVLDADEAARRIVRAVERGRRVYNFPWQTTMLVRLLQALPSALTDRLLTLRPREDT